MIFFLESDFFTQSHEFIIATVYITDENRSLLHENGLFFIVFHIFSHKDLIAICFSQKRIFSYIIETMNEHISSIMEMPYLIDAIDSNWYESMLLEKW